MRVKDGFDFLILFFFVGEIYFEQSLKSMSDSTTLSLPGISF